MLTGLLRVLRILPSKLQGQFLECEFLVEHTVGPAPKVQFLVSLRDIPRADAKHGCATLRPQLFDQVSAKYILAREVDVLIQNGNMASCQRSSESKGGHTEVMLMRTTAPQKNNTSPGIHT